MIWVLILTDADELFCDTLVSLSCESCKDTVVLVACCGGFEVNGPRKGSM